MTNVFGCWVNILKIMDFSSWLGWIFFSDPTTPKINFWKKGTGLLSHIYLPSHEMWHIILCNRTYAQSLQLLSRRHQNNLIFFVRVKECSCSRIPSVQGNEHCSTSRTVGREHNRENRTDNTLCSRERHFHLSQSAHIL